MNTKKSTFLPTGKSVLHKYITYVVVIVIAFAVQDFILYSMFLTLNNMALSLPSEILFRALYPIISIFVLTTLKS